MTSYLKIIKNDNKTLELVTNNLDLSFINGLRRILIGEIGCYAFDEIEITKNTTVFHNEFIMHRIGLIPLILNREMTFKCSVVNSDNGNKYVLSNDIRSIDESIEYKIMKNIPIIVLGKNEEISFVAKASKDIAKKDIKYALLERVKFIKMKEVEGDELKSMMYKNMYYGRKYLLNKKYKETDRYYFYMRSIFDDVYKILKIGLMKMKNMLIELRDKDIEMVMEKDSRYYNYKIRDIDYIESAILTSMLMKREDVKLATYTRKHFLDDFFEFKLELKESDRISILKIKEEEMEKAIKIVDVMLKEV